MVVTLESTLKTGSSNKNQKKQRNRNRVFSSVKPLET